jgi:Cof subfamily protein (haloacid dehalogenase superfamily)
MPAPSRKAPQPGQIKMIALDLDGTLLRSDHTIGPRTIAALHEAHRRGVEVILNSGRMVAAMEKTADLLGLDVYAIGYNGAAASAPRAQGRRRLFQQPVPMDVARELYQISRERHLHLNYYRDELVYSEDHADLRRHAEVYRSRTGSPFRFVPRLEEYFDVAPLKVIFVTDPPVRDQLAVELGPRFAGRANMTKTDPEYLEFLHPEVDKGVGLKGLSDALHLPLTAVMAVGDADNDAPMVATAGWGVAVANARECVRRVACAITENDCDHDGVAEAVERWVLFRA